MTVEIAPVRSEEDLKQSKRNAFRLEQKGKLGAE